MSDRRVVPTTCWECSTCCGALATVEDGRVVDVQPNPAHPGSQGAFCVKGFRGLQGVTYGANRLLHPMRRVGPRGGGRWERIGWDAAFDQMADALASVRARHGAHAIAGATSGAFFSRSVVFALMLRSIGSPNWMINQDLCGGGRAVSDLVTGLGIQGGEDVDQARTLLVVGANPAAANPVQWARIKAARARGARIVVVDPLATPVTRLADVWLRPQPGTDGAIGMAMLHVLIAEDRIDHAFVRDWCHGFEALADRAAAWTPARAAAVAGVAVDAIVAAARLYAEGPSTFVSGHGIDAVTNAVQTFRVFHALVAITGNLDRPGGNRRAKRPAGFRNYLDLLHDPAHRLPPEVEAMTLGADRFPLWAGPRGWQTACHNPAVIEAILGGGPYPVRAMLVSGVNIAVTYPDTQRTLAALRSLDFLAVATHTMNPTAAVADLVLPKTTTLEEEEVSLQQGAPCLAFTAAVAARQGESRPDIEIAAGLLDAMRARGAITAELLPWRTQREFNAHLLERTTIALDDLARDGYATFPFTLGEYAGQGFRTPTGKVELRSERMAEAGLDPLPGWTPPASAAARTAAFPLVLQTGLRERAYHHSRFRDQDWARRISAHPSARVHPETATGLGVAAGDWIAVETPAGSGAVRLRVTVTEDTQPGVVATGMGWWLPEAAGPEFGALEVNVNAALSYRGPTDPASGSPDSRGIPCRARRIDVPAA